MQRLHDVWLELDRVRHDLAAAAAQVTDQGTGHGHGDRTEGTEVAVRTHDFLRAYA